MDQHPLLPLASWQNFYVVVGSAAGALTGIQFVVITLIAQTRMAVGGMREIRAFATPTVIHFCTALLVSSIMVAPWESIVALAVCLGIAGLAGIIYSLRIFWHARKAVYTPDAEDWIWYTVLPLAAHLALAMSAVLLWHSATWSLITVAADSLLFLLLGVHNSWDTVTYIAVNHAANANGADAERRPDPTGRLG